MVNVVLVHSVEGPEQSWDCCPLSTMTLFLNVLMSLLLERVGWFLYVRRGEVMYRVSLVHIGCQELGNSTYILQISQSRSHSTSMKAEELWDHPFSSTSESPPTKVGTICIQHPYVIHLEAFPQPNVEILLKKKKDPSNPWVEW